jgi:hypothetical protein
MMERMEKGIPARRMIRWRRSISSNAKLKDYRFDLSPNFGVAGSPVVRRPYAKPISPAKAPADADAP